MNFRWDCIQNKTTRYLSILMSFIINEVISERFFFISYAMFYLVFHLFRILLSFNSVKEARCGCQIIGSKIASKVNKIYFLISVPL